MKNIMYETKVFTEILEKENLIITWTVSLQKIRENELEINDLLEAAIVFSKKFSIDIEGSFKLHHRSKKSKKIRFTT